MKTIEASPLRLLKVSGDPLTEQQYTVLRLREEKRLTYEQIGLIVGMSMSRVQKMYVAAKDVRDDYAQNGRDALSLLPARARNLLTQLNLASRPQVKLAIIRGEFCWLEKWKMVRYKGSSPRGMGRESWLALLEWVSDEGASP